MNRLTLTLTILLFGSLGSYSQVFELSYQDWPNTCSFKTDSGKIFINSMEDFKKSANCSSLKYIGYLDYTLIGVQGSIGGSSPPVVDFRIYQNDEKKEYIIESIVVGYGIGKRLMRYSRIIYVNKFKSNYRVVFKKIIITE